MSSCIQPTEPTHVNRTIHLEFNQPLSISQFPSSGSRFAKVSASDFQVSAHFGTELRLSSSRRCGGRRQLRRGSQRLVSQGRGRTGCIKSRQRHPGGDLLGGGGRQWVSGEPDGAVWGPIVITDGQTEGFARGRERNFPVAKTEQPDLDARR